MHLQIETKLVVFFFRFSLRQFKFKQSNFILIQLIIRNYIVAKQSFILDNKRDANVFYEQKRNFSWSDFGFKKKEEKMV